MQLQNYVPGFRWRYISISKKIMHYVKTIREKYSYPKNMQFL